MDSDSALRIAAELKNLSVIRRFVQETASAFGADRDMIADVILATDEAATNVIVHGYQNQQKADRAANRHGRHRTHALTQWSKAEYWQTRTAGVISHALYTSTASVRRGR